MENRRRGCDHENYASRHCFGCFFCLSHYDLGNDSNSSVCRVSDALDHHRRRTSLAVSRTVSVRIDSLCDFRNLRYGNLFSVSAGCHFPEALPGLEILCRGWTAAWVLDRCYAVCAFGVTFGRHGFGSQGKTLISEIELLKEEIFPQIRTAQKRGRFPDGVFFRRFPLRVFCAGIHGWRFLSGRFHFLDKSEKYREASSFMPPWYSSS